MEPMLIIGIMVDNMDQHTVGLRKRVYAHYEGVGETLLFSVRHSRGRS